MKSRIVLSLCLCLLLVGSLSAAQNNFTGSVDILWSNPGNWSVGIVPGVDDSARIQSGGLCVLDYAAPPVNQVNIRQAGSHLQLVDGAHLICYDWAVVALNGTSVEDPGVMEILGGVFDLHSHLRVSDDTPALFVIDYTGVMNIHNVELRVGHDDGGDGIVEVRGGSLNLLPGVNAMPLVFRNGANAKAHMDFSGGVMTMEYSDERLAFINDHIADGTITAYYKFPASRADYIFDVNDAVGTVIVDTGEANDYIHVSGLHPLNPTPADSSTVQNGPVTLSWNVDAGTAVDVWLATKADYSDAQQLVEKQVATSVQINTEEGVRYFWAVDTYVAGAEEPNFSPSFDFLAVANFPPEVSAGENVTTWIDNGSVTVTLAGTVNETADTLWTVVSEPDDPNNPQAVIADPTALDTTITLSALGEYVLQLDANDGELDAVSSQMAINVYADGCLAAQSLPDYIPFPGDIDGDCDVDQDDLDLLTADWLQCNSLDVCDPNVPDPNAL
ncbi:hypothetical protein ACFL3F_00740 [Planctomycetota bacterium]